MPNRHSFETRGYDEQGMQVCINDQFHYDLYYTYIIFEILP